MEAEPNHFFVHPDVIETHIERGTPIPEGTVKLLWVLRQLRPPEGEPNEP